MALSGEYSIATRFSPASSVAEPGVELLASGVRPLVARQVVEVVALDRVHQPPRLALGRDQVVPAARGQLAAGRRGPASRVAIGFDPWKS